MTADSGAGRAAELCSVVLMLYGDPWECGNTHVGHEIHEARLADISVTWVTAKSVGTPKKGESGGGRSMADPLPTSADSAGVQRVE